MKQLQNNFTTPEQSKRLLELGVPADSADCFRYYEPHTNEININAKQIPCGMSFDEYMDIQNRNGFATHSYYPVWSVGRLIEIMLICHIGEAAHIDFDKTICNITDWAIRVFESAIKCEHIDFSKLED